MSDDSGIDWLISAETRFKKAMVDTVEEAKHYDKVCYLYLVSGGHSEYGISFTYWDNWLFRAYPGGRKSLSMAGKKRLKECQI
jgi:hypothetical protein